MHYSAGLHRHLAVVSLLLASLAVACGGGGGGDGEQPATPTPIPPDQLFVRATGNDGNSGTSADDAFRTIAQAATQAIAGQTIYVGPGTYTVPRAFGENSVDIEDINGGTLRIVADRQGSMTNDDPGPIVVNARNGFGFRITRSSNVVIEGFDIERANGNESAGIQIRSNSTNIEIRDCTFTLNRDAIRMQGGSTALIFNNLIFRNNRGIRLNGAGPVEIYHNTIVDNRARGISISGGSGTSIARNNILQNNANRNIEVDSGQADSFDTDFNLIFSTARNTDPEDTVAPSTLIGDNDTLANALFISDSPTRPDYRLSNDGDISPAIDAGDGTIDAILLSLLFNRTTTGDGDADLPPIDLGYHEP